MPLHIQNEEGNYTNSNKRGKNDKPSKLKDYKITNKLVSEWFSYNNQQSFNSSSAKNRVLKGIEEVIEHVERGANTV